MGGNSVQANGIRRFVASTMVAATLLMVSWTVLPMQAQRIAAAAEHNMETLRITINFDNTPLPVALRTIAKQAGVAVMFDGSLVPSTKRVTLHGHEISVADALAQALRGTGLVANVHAEGNIAIVRSTEAEVTAGTITGQVIDAKTKHPLRGVSIGLDGADRVTVTSDDGRYRIVNVPVGSHTVTAKLLGYAKVVRTIAVEDSSATVDLSLDASATALAQVVVTGTVVQTELKAVPNAITVITAKDIEQRGITKIDQLFRGEIPGVFALNMGSGAPLDQVIMFSRGATALSDGSAGISTLGGSTAFTNPIKTYVDGVELADPKYLSQIDPSSIERIEILTGPQASTIYGSNAINGVMQIFTKRGTSNTPQLTLGLTSGLAQNNFSSHMAPDHLAEARASGVEGRWSYNVGGSWNYVGSWTPAKQTQRLAVDGGGRMDLSPLTMDIRVRQGVTQNRQQGDAIQGVTNLRAIGVEAPAGYVGLPNPEIQTLNGATGGITLGYHPLTWWSHEFGWGRDASTVETRRNTAWYSASLDGADTTLSIMSTTIARVSERYTTTMQVPLATRTHLQLTLGGDHWRMIGSQWSASPPLSLTGSLPGASVFRNHPDKNGGGFTQAQLSVSDALFFTYGLRAEWNPNFGDKANPNFAPRYGVTYTYETGLLTMKLRASYGRATRPPVSGRKLAIAQTIPIYMLVFGPYNSQLANQDLGPEHQQGGEAGAEFYWSTRTSLIITRYNQTVSNLISSVTGVDSVQSLTPDVNGFLTPSGSCTELGLAGGSGPFCYIFQAQYLNVGSIRNQGWELQGSVNTGPLTTTGTYSWTKSRVLGITPRYRALLQATDPVFAPGRPFDFVPEHIWALGITYARSVSNVSLMLNGVGMRYTLNDALLIAESASTRLTAARPRIDTPPGYRSINSGYKTADLNATHQVVSHMDVLFRVQNLTNRYRNDGRVDYASIGRQIHLGLKLHIH